MNRAVVVFISDEHGGHKLGLCSPDTVWWDEGVNGERVARYPRLGVFQEHLWELNMRYVDAVEEFADGCPVVIVHNGDLTHGTFHQEELITNSIDDQIEVGRFALTPWLMINNVVAARLFTGTGVHTFGGGSEVLTGKLLESDFPDIDIRVSSHGVLNVLGVTIDVAHHGPHPGSRKWLEGRQLRYYIEDLMLRDFSEGATPPMLVVRGHRHQWIPHETVTKQYLRKVYSTTGILLPAMCGLSAFGRKSAQSPPYITLGVVAVEVLDERVGKIVPLVETTDMRTRETLVLSMG